MKIKGILEHEEVKKAIEVYLRDHGKVNATNVQMHLDGEPDCVFVDCSIEVSFDMELREQNLNNFTRNSLAEQMSSIEQQGLGR